MKYSSDSLQVIGKIAQAIMSSPSETISSHKLAELFDEKLSTIHSDIKMLISQCYGIPNYINFIPEVKKVVKGIKMDFDEYGFITAFHLDKTHALALLLGYNLSKFNDLSVIDDTE